MYMAEISISDEAQRYLELKLVTDEESYLIYGDSTPVLGASKHLQKWLSLLPDNIIALIDAALQQERPFLPPDVTPEIMATNNSKVPSMNQMDILYRCVDFAIQAKQFNMAACIAFVVDRASYWSGMSKALLEVVDLIKKASPEVAIAPQVQVRKARVLKDEGDLHGAMRVLDQCLVRPQGLPGEWRYVDDDQYVTTKAEITKIKGHILHNMGLIKDAVEPLLESIDLFSSLQVKDDKGIASSLGLLTKCLGKLSLKEYDEVQLKFPDHFKTDHPCHESYVQGIEAVRYIQSLQESLYRSRHLLDADQSLLKYAILRQSLSEEYKLFQTMLKEMKTSLSAHKTVDVLKSSEQFFEFVRALFMISLTLAFSPVQQDRNLSEYIQQLSMELYLHLCNHNKEQQVARLGHTALSVKLMNLSLTILGLPPLIGTAEEEKQETNNQEEESLGKSDLPVASLVSELEHEEQNPDVLTAGQRRSTSTEELFNTDSSGESHGKPFSFSSPLTSSSGIVSSSEQPTSLDRQNSSTKSSSGVDIHMRNFSSHDEHNSQGRFRTEPSTGAFQSGQMKDKFYGTVGTSKMNNRQKNEFSKDGTFRGWTYSFGFGIFHEKTLDQRTKGWHTFSQVTSGKPLDPKKQWQRYKHKCVGLPVDPNFFSSPVPSDENLYEFDADVSSSDDEEKNLPPLVNMSVPFIMETVENRSKKKTMSPKDGSTVDRKATTKSISPGFLEFSEWCFLHPHDLPDQPMSNQNDREKLRLDEEVDDSEFAPLIDLSKTTLTESLEEVRLGKSIPTNDPVEYMINWHPPTQGHKIQRAFVLNYNPVTGSWTSQSTLAFLGDELDLSEDKKGHCRDAFHVQYLHQDEPRGRYVGKRYRRPSHHHPKRYMQDVVCQMVAGHYVTKFNEAMQNYKRDIQVQYLPAAHMQLLTPYGHLEDCINVEPYLHGDFIKLTNNFAFANKKEHRGEELATALTHFSYCESKGTLMIVDIQGWLPRESSGVIYLTDPQFHTSGIEKFSSYDHQQHGMTKFWSSVHPRCNDMCRSIGLERPQQ